MRKNLGPTNVLAAAIAATLALVGCKNDQPATTPDGAAQSGHSNVTTEGNAEGSTAPDIRTQEVTYDVAGVTMKGFLAYPAETNGKVPGVIVVHEWWGQNDYPRMRAKMLAELGYAALALDMFGEGKTTTHPKDAQAFVQAVNADKTVAKERFMAAKQLLAQQPMVDADKLAAIGYCFGGGVVLAMAREGVGLDAVASFHGSLGTEKPMQKGAFEGKILVANGAADPMVTPEQVEAIKQEMDAADVELELHNYEGAKHGFTNPGATELGKKHDMPLAYDPAADRASWAELVELLASVWPRE